MADHVFDDRLVARMAAQAPAAKAVVVYSTMWHSTEAMARAIGEGLEKGGATVKLMSMDHVHRSDVVYELLGAGVHQLERVRHAAAAVRQSRHVGWHQ